MPDRDHAHVWDMLQAISLIEEFLKSVSRERFLADRLIQSAVERQVEIIGEAANRVSDELKDSRPEIAWRQIVAMRNVLAHEYGEIVQERMWNLVVNDLPVLSEQLRGILPPE